MIELNFLKDKKIGVLGLGKTGCAAVESLNLSGSKVFCFDDNSPTSSDWSCVKNLDALIVSPGIKFSWPKMHNIVKEARNNLVPIYSDLDLFLMAVKNKTVIEKKIIAITGTNGKSTTTALIWHTLKECGYKVDVGGNFGVPVLSMDDNADIYVVEVSSYQLDLSFNPCFDISILLNITPDHLERHGGMFGYVAAKEKVFLDSDLCVISQDSSVLLEITKYLEQIHKNVVKISQYNSHIADVFWNNNELYDRRNNKIICGDTQILSGLHNQQNIAAAYAALKHIGVSDNDFADSLQSFCGLEHRQEILNTDLMNVKIINDSKATNAESTEQAFLRFLNDDILWIAGGIPKEGGISSLNKYFRYIKQAFLIGNAENEFYEILLKHGVICRKCTTLDVAVDAAINALQDYSNPVVLFSPACASFDQFKNFEDRGDRFKKIIKEYKNGAS